MVAGFNADACHGGAYERTASALASLLAFCVLVRGSGCVVAACTIWTVCNKAVRKRLSIWGYMDAWRVHDALLEFNPLADPILNGTGLFPNNHISSHVPKRVFFVFVSSSLHFAGGFNRIISWYRG